MLIVADPPAPCIENDTDAWNDAPDLVHENPLIVGAETAAAAVVAGAAARVVRVVAGACTVLVVTAAAGLVVVAGTAASVVAVVVVVVAGGVAGSGVQVAVAVAVEVTVATIVGPDTGGWFAAARRTRITVMVSDRAATATTSTSHGHRLGSRGVPSSPSHGASL